MPSIKIKDIPSFVADSIDQLAVAELGYRTNDGAPFVTLESGLTFYGRPVELVERSGALLSAQQSAVRLIQGAINLMNGIRLRYCGVGRELHQHSHYTYKPGDVVLELGAYHGFYSVYIAERIGPSGTLIAVEFMPDNYEILDLNLRANFPDRATALNVGIDACCGKKKAFVGNEQVAGFQEDVIARHEGADYQTLEVRTATVDSIVDEHGIDAVDLAIVQVNGHEIAAFEGMQESLPKIKNMAIASPYNDTDILSERLREAGFQVKIEKDRWIYASRSGFLREEPLSVVARC